MIKKIVCLVSLIFVLGGCATTSTDTSKEPAYKSAEFQADMLRANPHSRPPPSWVD